MALKDWEKIEDDGSGNRRIGWKRKDGKDFMVLFLPNPKQKDPYFRHDWIARNENNFRIEFKTKSEALRYAKEYMKKHPSVDTRSKNISKGISKLSKRIK